MRIQLEVKNEVDQVVLDYLEANASDELVAKINNGTPTEKDGVQLINKKTFGGFWDFIYDELQKMERTTCTTWTERLTRLLSPKRQCR